MGVKGVLDEYFVSGDADEAARALAELDHAEFHHEVVKSVISRYAISSFCLGDKNKLMISGHWICMTASVSWRPIFCHVYIPV